MKNKLTKPKYSILYETTNNLNGKTYAGVHQTNNLEDGYIGSGKYFRKAVKKYGKHNFTRAILKYCDDFDSMVLAEAEYVNEEYVARDDTYNLQCGGNSDVFNTTRVRDCNNITSMVDRGDPRIASGELIPSPLIIVKDKDGNVSHVELDDPGYLSGDLVGIAKGKVVVRDHDGNSLQIDSDDERYLSGELKHISVGRVSVVDKDGNHLNVNVDDQRYLSGELSFVMTGLTIAKHKDTSERCMLPVDDHRLISGEYVGITTGYTNVIDDAGNKYHVKVDDPRILSGELYSENKGKTIIIDPETGNNVWVTMDDERYLDPNRKTPSSGIIMTVDKRGNSHRVRTDDWRYLSGELVPESLGRIQLHDSNGKNISVKPGDPRLEDPEYTRGRAPTNKITVHSSTTNRNTWLHPDDSRIASGEFIIGMYLDPNRPKKVWAHDGVKTSLVVADDPRIISGELTLGRLKLKPRKKS